MYIKHLYIQFLESMLQIYSISCIFLLNSTCFINFRVQDVFNTQTTAKAVSKNGILFFGLVNNTAVGCWNEHQTLQRENTDMVAQNEETLQMIVGMKIKQLLPHIVIIDIDNIINDEYMLVLTNRMQKILNNDLNFNDINFRILIGGVSDLLENTRCTNFNIQNDDSDENNDDSIRITIDASFN